ALLTHTLSQSTTTSLSPATFVFFFFQAEDGIRDGHVTGVQTCALPIYPSSVAGGERPADGLTGARVPEPKGVVGAPRDEQASVRSEERRVGKEGRCRWWRDE